MASKHLFGSAKSSIPHGVMPTDTVNEAGGVAYAFGPEHGLAQFALTGTFNGTFYASDEDQMEKTLAFASKCEPTFVAQTAVYARENGFMKDMPAFLLAYITGKDSALMKSIFPRVVDSPKMVRNFVQMIRSGKLGRKSLGTAPKKLVTGHLNSLSDVDLFRSDIGNSPTLQDIIKMVHPTPKTLERAALYGYLLSKKNGRFGDKSFEVSEHLPDVVQEYEAFKKAIASATTDAEKNKLVVPNVPFLMLTALPLTKEHWKGLARRMSWPQLRMNLNTLQRQGAFEDAELVKFIAEKLVDREQIVRARAFPYQLFAAYTYMGADVPTKIRNAIIDAADIAIDNVPKIDGQVVVCPDVSGSMHDPVTGRNGTATSKVRCIDVAALVAAAVLRQNPEALVLPFEHDVKRLRLNPRDSVLTNAEKLAKLGGGGTNCSAPFEELNKNKTKADLVWYVSDNQSWVDQGPTYYGGVTSTGMMSGFTTLKQRCPGARLVCLDINPYGSTQAHERKDVMNVGGFSDSVFEAVSAFSKGGTDAKTLVDTIKAIKL